MEESHNLEEISYARSSFPSESFRTSGSLRLLSSSKGAARLFQFHLLRNFFFPGRRLMSHEACCKNSSLLRMDELEVGFEMYQALKCDCTQPCTLMVLPMWDTITSYFVQVYTGTENTIVVSYWHQ